MPPFLTPSILKSGYVMLKKLMRFLKLVLPFGNDSLSMVGGSPKGALLDRIILRYSLQFMLTLSVVNIIGRCHASGTQARMP